MLKRLLAAVAATLILHGGALAQEPIKVGLLNFDSGPFTVFAPFIRDGATFAIETLNAQGGALGRKYELVTQAHSGTPAAALAALSRLVEQQGVPFVAGLSSSSTSLAISPKLAGLNALLHHRGVGRPHRQELPSELFSVLARATARSSTGCARWSSKAALKRGAC